MSNLPRFLFNNNMIKSANINVGTNGSLLQLIYILQCKENSQYSMLANPEYNKISIEKYKRENFAVFMLSLHVYVKILLTLVYLEVTSNIQC